MNRSAVMTRSAVWSVGIALGVAASVGAYQLYVAPQHEVAQPRTTKTTHTPEGRSSDETARLQTELTSVKAQLSAIKTHLATRSSASEAAENADEQEAPTPSPEEQRAQEALAWKEHMAKVAEAFNAEVIDPKWASVTSDTVETAIKADAVLAAVAGDVQCRSRTCRIELTKDATGAVDKQLPLFVNGLGGTLPYGQADRIDNGDGTTTLALYLSTQAPAQVAAR